MCAAKHLFALHCPHESFCCSRMLMLASKLPVPILKCTHFNIPKGYSLNPSVLFAILSTLWLSHWVKVFLSECRCLFIISDFCFLVSCCCPCLSCYVCWCTENTFGGYKCEDMMGNLLSIKSCHIFKLYVFPDGLLFWTLHS